LLLCTSRPFSFFLSLLAYFPLVLLRFASRLVLKPLLNADPFRPLPFLSRPHTMTASTRARCRSTSPRASGPASGIPPSRSLVPNGFTTTTSPSIRTSLFRSLSSFPLSHACAHLSFLFLAPPAPLLLPSILFPLILALISIPIFVRPSTVLPLGPADSTTPDYEYTSGLELRAYELGEGETKEISIPACKGKEIAALLKVSQQRGKKELKVEVAEGKLAGAWNGFVY
jgi:hypothetical protein